MAAPDPRGVYFAAEHLGEPEFNYVCWLDVMGSLNQMLRSLPTAATFVFQLHCAVIEAFEELNQPPEVRLYPIMDGVFITSSRRDPLQRILNQSLRRIVYEFLSEPKCHHQFLARGAVSFGPVYHGANIGPEAARVLADHAYIRDSIMLGLPVAQAYRAERDAPPFGIAAHDSARAFAPPGDSPFRFIWLDWFRAAHPPVDAGALLAALNKYFDWQREHSNMTGYESARIDHHQRLAQEYLTAND